MAGTEVKGLPLGNEWEFSARNNSTSLQPGVGRSEITQPPAQLQELVQHVQARYIRHEWQLVSTTVDSRPLNGEFPDLFIISTHPLRVALLEETQYDIDQFIKPEIVQAAPDSVKNKFYGDGVPPADDPMNKILTGTNWVVSSVNAAYNVIDGTSGNTYLQTGVGYFNLRLARVSWAITQTDRMIEEFMLKARPLQEEREAFLVLQSSNPVRLFT